MLFDLGVRRLRTALGGLVSELVQNSVTCCAATVVTAALALLASRFTAALACARALPITLFAPLSHMLMNGFFFSQGLLKSFHLLGCCAVICGRCRAGRGACDVRCAGRSPAAAAW